jgi:hypothetical protein
MARFWFHFADGHPTFRESEDIVWLDKASVVVLTERQRAAADGTLYDVPGDDPYTRGFAQDFSTRLDDAAATASVSADLENLFRLQALVAAMRFRRVAERAGFDLSFYLYHYQYQLDKPMPAELPGLFNSREVHETVRAGNTIYTFTFFPIIIGGVSMETPMHGGLFRHDTSGSLRHVGSAVLRERPGKSALCWPVLIE